MRWGLAAAFILACVRLADAGATYDVSTATDLFNRLSMVQAGDEIVVHAGTYTTPGYLNYTWTGTATNPIVIRAADGEHPIISGNRNQNVINISGSYFTFKGFEIRGGSHGLRLVAVDHSLLEDLVVHDLGDVGISCNLSPNNCTALTIRHSEIYDTGKDGGTGEGLYLGCNDGSCLLADSVIENNYVHDMGGSQGDGIEIKTGSYGNIVRDNVIVRSRYPGITMYGYTATGAANVVERNLVWHVLVDAGIQVVGQVIVRNNIVIDTVSYGIFSKPSNGLEPHDVTIVNNTVVGASACLRTTWTGQTNQVVANNALYCGATAAIDVGSGAAGATFANNIGLGTSGAPSGFTAGTSLAADLGDPATSLYPPLGSALVNAGSATYAAPDDFNAKTRFDGMPDVGAYERSTATNPGWSQTEGFKTPPAISIDGPSAGGDAGPGGNDTPPGNDSGCCSTTSRPRDGLLGLAVLALVLRRRRRTVSAASCA